MFGKETTVVLLAAGVLLAFAAGLAAYITRRSARRGRRLVRIGEQALLNRLAAGLAHEIKNPLSALNLNLQLLEEELEASGALPEHSRQRLRTIMGESHQLQDVVDNFLRYAKRRQLTISTVEVNKLVGEVMTFVKPELARAKIQLEMRFDENLAEAPADGPLLKQALFNVVLNAIEAMESGGALTVETGESGGAYIRVKDSGTGIDVEDSGRIFEAYFSTKRGGTGLGLSITRGIMEDHGGSVEIESARGTGTTVTLKLPPEGGKVQA